MNLVSISKTAKCNAANTFTNEYNRKITSNFVQNTSFDNQNTEEFFDYVEDDKKDQLQFNLNILNKNDEDNYACEDVTSQNSNIDEFYDAICNKLLLLII